VRPCHSRLKRGAAAAASESHSRGFKHCSAGGSGFLSSRGVRLGLGDKRDSEHMLFFFGPVVKL
jgi:hypothetical protein